MALRVYTVHLPPASANDGAPILVKEGFSWPAFVLGPIWTLWQRLWLVSTFLIAFYIALGAGLDALALDEITKSLISLTVHVLIGLSAADWRRAGLRRRGYAEVGVVSGPDLESALRRFLDLRAVDGSSTLPPGPNSPRGGLGSLTGWYASSFADRSTRPSGTRPLDPTTLRAAANQDRATMRFQPQPENSDPRRQASDYRREGSITLAADQSRLGPGHGF